MLKITKEIPFGEHTLKLETGEVARQAHGAVFARCAGTEVLVTVVGNRDKSEAFDFFPLTVDYQEKTYAAGKIPGSFHKREGRPSEAEILTSRLIDRALRPLFPEGFNKEVQIVATLMSLNPDVPADIIAIIATSAALAISGIPFDGPLAAARVGYKNGIYLLNPGHKACKDSDLDLVVAGTHDAILMVESEARELSEEIMLGAVLYGQEMFQGVIKAIQEMADDVGTTSWDWEKPPVDEDLKDRVHKLASESLSNAYLIKDKLSRYKAIADAKQQVVDTILAENAEANAANISTFLTDLESQIVRNRILDGEPRIDGRDRVTVRPIAIRPKFLERTHGSVLFTRGETQAIVVVTLGNEADAQLLDPLTGVCRDRFMLHYNFPPYSVGEIGRVGSPKRREIGHGRLARRSLMAVLPTAAEFPYVLRIVSEITESNGSSSMATVCGSSLALMDAGVPLKAPVAGVAMGLIKDGERFAVLTDILGDEDHLGDMDFKVAGTENGVTALQMDIKIKGITKEIMEQALDQALAGRLHILGVMNNVLAGHRDELSEHAPRISTMKVAEDKIRTIIGKGGATIKGLIESTGVSIDIDDTGLVQLFSPDVEALEEAQRQIKILIADIEVGQTYRGKVNKIVEFGAFVNLLPGKDGLLHISQICSDRTQKVETVLKEGQEIEVFIAGVDKQGRVKLVWNDKPEALKSTSAGSSEVSTTEAPVETEDDEAEDKES